MHTHATKFNRQRLWRGTDRHQTWGCALNGQRSTVLPSIPLVHDLDSSLVIVRWNSKSWTDRCTLMEQSLADRGDGENLIYSKPRGVHSTDSRLHPSQLCLKRMIWALACWLCGEILNSERLMHTQGTKFNRQRIWRGADRHQTWGCACYGQPNTVIPIMPLVQD